MSRTISSILTFIVSILKLFTHNNLTILILIVINVAGLYSLFRPTPPDYSELKEHMLLEFHDKVREWLATFPAQGGQAVLYTFGNDEFGYVTDSVREIVAQTDRFRVRDYTIDERLAKFTRWTRATTATQREALDKAREENFEIVIWGVVREYADLGSVGHLRVTMEIIPLKAQRDLRRRDFDIVRSRSLLDSPPPKREVPEAERAQFRDSSFELPWPLRFLVWMLFVLLLPVVLYPISVRIVLGDSNHVILAYLLGLVSLDTILAWFFIFNGNYGLFEGLLQVGLSTLALLFNYKILDKIKESRE